MKEMFAMIGIEGKTNHSLRATGATALYSSNVPEKIIQQRTGHQSLKALRTYERTSKYQHMAVSKILTVDSPVDFSAGVSKPGKQVNSYTQSQVKSFTPNIASMFGPTTNCVINVNFANSTSNVTFQAKQDCKFENDGIDEEMERSLASSSMDFDI